MGLLIAIPSLIFWSYFSKKVEVFAVEMEALCDDFVRRQYSEMARTSRHRKPALWFLKRSMSQTPNPGNRE